MSSEYSQRRWIEFKTLVAALVKSKGDREVALVATAKTHPKRTFIPKDVDKAVRLATSKLTPKTVKPAKVADKPAVRPTSKRAARTTTKAPARVMSVVPNFLGRLSAVSVKPKA